MPKNDMTKDTIVNTHELAYAHPNFIWHITTLPDLTVICGEQEMLELLQELVHSKDRQLILSYDTTFSLGEFYVSPLLFRNVYFNSNPVMPALFLIHERKLQSTYETLFSFLESRLKKLKGVPWKLELSTPLRHARKCEFWVVGDISVKMWKDGYKTTWRNRQGPDMWTICSRK